MSEPTTLIPLPEIVMHLIVGVFIPPLDFRFAMTHTAQRKTIEVIHSSHSSRGN